MSKVKNRKKFLISDYKLIIIFLFIILVLSITYTMKDNLINILYKNIEQESKKYGYILKTVNISGINRISQKNIYSLFQKNINESIFLISLKKIKEQIIKNNWVENFTIKIQYPSSIILNIVEKKPIAIFYDENDDYFFLDENGNKIEEVNDITNEQFILITGEQAMNNVSGLIKNLYPYKNFNVISAKYVGSRRWDLSIDQDLIVKLPENNYQLALKNLNDIFIDLKEFNYESIEYVDLRLIKKAIIRFNNYNEINLFGNQ